MGRIRTIKPDFFKHEALYDAEMASGLPLRLAFSGLWTVADRDGRFRWRPRVLKLDVLPYDELDFSAVLDALEAAGFIQRYAIGGEEFGCIPSWHRHQLINAREARSVIPAPETKSTHLHVHARACMENARGERELERKGKEVSEPDGSSSAAAADSSPGRRPAKAYPEAFEAAWAAYPSDRNMSKLEAFEAWRKLEDKDREMLMASIPAFRAYCRQNPDYRVIHMNRYIRYRRFDGHAGANEAPARVDEGAWRTRLVYARHEKRWSTPDWGPLPGLSGCRVPSGLLEPGDGQGWAEFEACAA
jgi:hypothetical protein